MLTVLQVGIWWPHVLMTDQTFCFNEHTWAEIWNLFTVTVC